MKHAITLSAHQIGYIRGEHRLFGGIDFELKAGTALRITGANGSGKTSMLRILSGIAPPERGNVRWHGCDIRAIRDVYSSERLYVGHAIGVKDDLLAWENVALNSLMSGTKIDRRQACEALVNAGLKAAVDLPARALSQGQRKRLALMRLRFATTRPLWILDEPFAALDAEAASSLCAELNGHLARGGTLVYVTHQEIALPATASVHLEYRRVA